MKKYKPLVWYSLAKNSPPKNEQLVFWVKDKEHELGGYSICGVVLGKKINALESGWPIAGVTTHFMLIPELFSDAPCANPKSR